MSGYARSFKDLRVYRKSTSLADDIFRVTQRFPPEEMYSLTSQLRRASTSIGAQIAEAWGRRRYSKHFISKLTDARSEALETMHWIETASSRGLLGPKQSDAFSKDLEELDYMLRAMIRKAHLFCRDRSAQPQMPRD